MSPCHLVTLSAHLLAILSAGLLTFPCRADYDALIDSYMYRDPELVIPPVVYVLPKRATELWLRALVRPEAEFRYQAAQAISLAHERGFKVLEVTVEPLRTALNRPDEQPVVRLAIARALIELDVRLAAADLLRQAQAGDSDLRGLVEPVLARWDYKPARKLWLERLRDPATPADGLKLAIQGLATVREGQAADALRDIVLQKVGGTEGRSGPGARSGDQAPAPDDVLMRDYVSAPDQAPAHDHAPAQGGETSTLSSYRPFSPSVRLEAARALALLRPTGLEKDAERLADDTSFNALLSRLAAALLLGQHRSAEAIRLLERLEMDPEPAVAALAVGRLIEIDSRLVLPALDHLLGSSDANLRALAAKVLFQQPSAEHIRLLADRLDDVDRNLRIQVRDWLGQLAGKKEWHDPVIAQASRILAAQDWRGLEQSAILLTLLDHKPSAGRLVELLRSGRAEVVIAAAWGLRRLAVPETLPGVLSYVEGEVRFRGGKATARPWGFPSEIIDHALSQLDQFLGQQKYGPAEPVLRHCIPRGRAGFETRAAAIWALGLIHQGQVDLELVAALEARLNDIRSRPPEDRRVRRMSAISLGRIMARALVDPHSKDRQFAQEHLPVLQNYCGSEAHRLEMAGNACAWAVEQITGQALPPLKPIQKAQRNWFLSPSD